MEPLTSFTDEEVLEDLQQSNWMRITLSKLEESSSSGSENCNHSHSCSRSCRSHSRGSFLLTHSIGQSRPTATILMMRQEVDPVQEVEPQRESTVS